MTGQSGWCSNGRTGKGQGPGQEWGSGQGQGGGKDGRMGQGDEADTGGWGRDRGMGWGPM